MVRSKKTLRSTFQEDMEEKWVSWHGARIFIFYLFIKTYLYRVVHNQTILILFYSVALFLDKSKSSDN